MNFDCNFHFLKLQRPNNDTPNQEKYSETIFGFSLRGTTELNTFIIMRVLCLHVSSVHRS